MAELSMQEAMQKFLKQSRLKNDLMAIQIEEVWSSLMGKTIANYTDSIKIIGQTLLISTSNAPLKNELLFQKDKIKERVNEALGDKLISEVIIK